MEFDRREFLKLLGSATLLSQIPLLGGCGKSAHNVSPSQLLQEVKKIQSSLSSFPENPVAIAWDPSVDHYPRLREVHPPCGRRAGTTLNRCWRQRRLRTVAGAASTSKKRTAVIGWQLVRSASAPRATAAVETAWQREVNSNPEYAFCNPKILSGFSSPVPSLDGVKGARGVLVALRHHQFQYGAVKSRIALQVRIYLPPPRSLNCREILLRCCRNTQPALANFGDR